MHVIAIANRAGPLRSSLALSHDVLWTANRVAVALGKPAPFEIRLLGCVEDFTPDAAVLVVPGLGLASEEAVASDLAEASAEGWIELVRTAAAPGRLVVSSCSGVFLLGAAGLLDNRECTTSWFLAPLLAQCHPSARVQADAVLVEDGPIVTGGAAMAQGETMIALVTRLAGFEIADLVARYLLLDNRRSQADFRLIGPMVAGDRMLATAERWVRDHIGSQFSIAEMTGAIGITPWTFARRLSVRCGMTPVRFVNHIRRERAQALLAGGARFDQAAFAVGYSDASSLRRLLAKRTSPTDQLVP